MFEEITKYLLPVLKAKEKSILSGKEVTLKGISPLSILLKISKKDLAELFPAFEWYRLESILLFCPLFLTEGIIRVRYKTVSLSYSIPENISAIKLFDRPFFEMSADRPSLAFLITHIKLILLIIHAIISKLLGWKCRNLDIFKEISASSIKIVAYIPDKDPTEIVNYILKRVAENALYRLKKINEEELRNYLREINYITKNGKPLMPYLEIEDALEKYTEGFTLRICLYCDEKFFAKGKAQYNTPSCKVLHFQKKKLVGKEALLEDGTKVKIKDFKKEYVMVEYPDKRGIQKAATKRQLFEGTDLPLIVHIMRHELPKRENKQKEVSQLEPLISKRKFNFDV